MVTKAEWGPFRRGSASLPSHHGSQAAGTDVKYSSKAAKGFTLVELLVVMAIIAILAALLLLGLSSARAKTQRTVCVNNLRQISLGVRMYSDDSQDASPSAGPAGLPISKLDSLFAGYKALMKNYVGLKGASSPQDKLFACPADILNAGLLVGDHAHLQQFINKSVHDSTNFDYSSYAFNGGDNVTRTIAAGKRTVSFTLPGLTGFKLSAVKHPDRTLLLLEVPAFFPYSWHDPSSHGVSYENGMMCQDSKNVVSFVDGHVSYIKMYCAYHILACHTNPPSGYDYQWTPD
jgi:prepilin-type N-terminal cleavage/methylation domain-containing protein